MGKPLRCRLGFHKWDLEHYTSAGVFDVIVNCLYCPQFSIQDGESVAWELSIRKVEKYLKGSLTKVDK